MKRSIKRKGLAVLALTVLSVAGFYKWYHDHQAQKGVVGQPVLVSVVVQEKIPLELPTVGSTISFASVEIKPRVTAPIAKVFFEEGALVKEGQSLFQLDDRAIRAQVAQAEADRLKNKTQRDYLKRQYERAAKVFASGYGSEQAIDSARNDYESAEAMLAQSEANLKDARTQLSYTLIQSPITGRTGTIFKTLGNIVDTQSSDPLVSIHQISPMKVQFSLPQRYFEPFRIALSQKTAFARVKTPEMIDWQEASVQSFDNTLDENNQFQIQASLKNEQETFWPGMYVEVLVHLKEEEVFTIPESAVLLGQNNQAYVYVLEHNQAHKRNIEVDRFVENKAIVKSGLKLQEIVIMDGMSRLRDNIEVRVIQP